MTAVQPSDTLAPYRFEPGDPYIDPDFYKACERFWWHGAVLREVERAHELGLPGIEPVMIASNLDYRGGGRTAWNASDVTRYCRQMISWGELVEAEPSVVDGRSWRRVAVAGWTP